jgi:site-specific recombinase XerD
MNALTRPGAGLRQADPVEMLTELRDCYQSATKVFLRFLEEHGHGIDAEGIAAFSAWLREEHDGKRLQSRTVNYYLSAIKHRVRFLLDHAPNIDDRTRAAVEHVLGELKAEKVSSAAVSAEKCLTYVEIGKVIDRARAVNPRVALIAEFLAVAGTRISETLHVLNADVKAMGGQYRIIMHGKGGKDRKVFIPAELYQRIRAEFHGLKYLFAHASTQRLYSRSYVSMTLRRIGEKAIGREISAHVFRHSFATDMLRRNPGDLVAISRYLGHSQVSTTENIYLHGGYSGADIAAKAPRIDGAAQAAEVTA